MRGVKSVFVLLAAVAILLAGSSQLFAQATRTWVSGVGDDVNPCSRTAPCKTFSGAISKTAAGGIIDALDPGGYGTVTITKSMTIDTSSTLGSILASGVVGVNVNAGPTDVVVLRGLQINGAGTTLGTIGVRFIAGGALYIEDCTISNFSNRGVSFEPTSGNSQLFITNTTITNNGPPSNAATSAGINLVPAAAANVKASIEKSRIGGNTRGLLANSRANVTISDSVISGNVNAGIDAEGIGRVNVSNCTVANNGTGIFSGATGATVRISNNTIVGNQTGLGFAAGGGNIVSLGNNAILGNTGSQGTPSSTTPLK